MQSPKPKRRDVIIVGGQTGTGKTYFTNSLLMLYPRVIILSPIEAEEEEYTGYMFDSFPALIDHFESRKSLKFFRVKLSDVSNFSALCQFVYDLGYVCGGLVFCIEEAQRVIPARQELCPEFKDILYRGRHPEVSLIMVSQRFSTISIEARSQWRRIVSFRQTEPSDVNWLINTTGDPRAASVPSFPDRKYIDITPHTSQEVYPPKTGA